MSIDTELQLDGSISIDAKHKTVSQEHFACAASVHPRVMMHESFSVWLLGRFLHAQVSELDTNDLHLLEVRTQSNEFLHYQKDWFPSLVFAHLRDEHCVHHFFGICQLLGQRGDLAVLIDHLLDQFSLIHSSQGPEVLLVLLKVLRGAARCGAVTEVPISNSDGLAVHRVLEELTDYSRSLLTENPVKQRCQLICLHSLRLLVLEQCALLLGEVEGE